MVVHLGTMGSEEGDGGLGGRESQAPLIGPIMDPRSLEREGRGCISVVTGGDGVSEIIGIGEGEVIILGVGGDKEVEEDGGDARALGNARSGVVLVGGGVVVPAASHTTFEVCGQPPESVVGEVGGVKGGEEFCVVDHIESFR